jgi:predicted flap endonuclease-1-like 5' DNA nuclease
MVVFILQSLFLIAAAFIIGAMLGNIFKRLSPKKDSATEGSTRAADVRLASLSALVTPANDDVKKSAKDAAAMIPPAEPVPAPDPAAPQPAAKPSRKTAAKKSPAKVAAKRVQNPRQNDRNRPATLKAARRGKPDRLTEIDGIGNAIEGKLFELGIFHYDQIAGWTADEASWVSEEISFPGRAQRENWIKQAAGLVKPAAGTKAASAKAAPKKAAAKAAAAPKTPAKASRTDKSG